MDREVGWVPGSRRSSDQGHAAEMDRIPSLQHLVRLWVQDGASGMDLMHLTAHGLEQRTSRLQARLQMFGDRPDLSEERSVEVRYFSLKGRLPGFGLQPEVGQVRVAERWRRSGDGWHLSAYVYEYQCDPSNHLAPARSGITFTRWPTWTDRVDRCRTRRSRTGVGTIPTITAESSTSTTLSTRSSCWTLLTSRSVLGG